MRSHVAIVDYGSDDNGNVAGPAAAAKTASFTADVPQRTIESRDNYMPIEAGRVLPLGVVRSRRSVLRRVRTGAGIHQRGGVKRSSLQTESDSSRRVGCVPHHGVARLAPAAQLAVEVTDGFAATAQEAMRSAVRTYSESSRTARVCAA
jgi:hypothetical protein